MKKIAIQGYEGSFHHIVAKEYFGDDISLRTCDTFREVARSVLDGDVDYGIMAIENSIAGSILPNYGLLQNTTLQVIGEYYINIQQHLMALPGVTLGDIEEVHSHPMALLQCVDYLDEHKWKLVETEDTALSARNVARKGLRNTAAIAGELAAEIYGMEIIAPSINTISNNYTRFLILSRGGRQISRDSNKASLCFKTNHKHGSLLRVLNRMEDTSINLTKLQSSPIPSEPWHYMFHVDMEFDTLSDYIQVLKRIRESTQSLHVYGVYKKATDN